jgi:hypothetical protein
MQRQHETNKMRTASAHDPRPKRRNHRFAVRRLPALPPVERRLGLRHQVLNGDLRIALEARTRRGRDAQRHLPVDRKLGDAGAAPALRRLVVRARRAPLRPFRRFLHPGRLVRRTRRQCFSRAISSFSIWFSTLCAASAAPSFSFSSRRRVTSPINRRTRPISSAGGMRSSESIEPGVMPSVNQTFPNVSFSDPSPPRNLPRLHASSLELLKMGHSPAFKYRKHWS